MVLVVIISIVVVEDSVVVSIVDVAGSDVFTIVDGAVVSLVTVSVVDEVMTSVVVVVGALGRVVLLQSLKSASLNGLFLLISGDAHTGISQTVIFPSSI